MVLNFQTEAYWRLLDVMIILCQTKSDNNERIKGASPV